MPTTRCIPVLAILVAVCLLRSPCRASPPGLALDEVIDSPMYRAPDLPAPPVVTVFPERALSLWLKALGRPEAEMRYRAADAIALAHRRGVKGLERTIAPLLAVVDRPDQHPAVRLAAARALIALEVRKAAPSLFRHAQAGDSVLRSLVEPALARWDYQPARAVWLERLRQPTTPPRSLVLAIRGLATVREEKAADQLHAIALSSRVPGPIRLEAARALGVLRAVGLEKDAERLAADTSVRDIVARLVAASLLRQHQSEAAIRLLQALTRDPEPAVAALAVARLLEIDPGLVVPALEHLLASPDAKLRSLGVEVLLRRPTEEHIRLLGNRLDDPHPEVRGKARRSLRELGGKKELRNQVIAAAARVLATQQWRGLEQATILLTQLDHKPAAGRLVELLTFDRPEVFVTAAWGLRKLAVPETLPRVVRYVEAEAGILSTGKDPVGERAAPLEAFDHQLSQLNQLLGQQRYGPADRALRRFIPYATFPESRAAAIWALGLIHQGKKVPALVPLLEARLQAESTIPPEYLQVRGMCAVTLARLKAKEALPSLRTYYRDRGPSNNPVNNACGWAIEQLTGEAYPPPKTFEKMQRDWFLTPHQ